MSWLIPCFLHRLGLVGGTTTESATTTLAGSQVLSDVGVKVSGSGVSASFNLKESISWAQKADVSATFTSSLVRQGRSPSPSDLYAATGAGTMSVTWILGTLQVAWTTVTTLNLGSPSFFASGPCALRASGAPYACTLTGPQLTLLDTYPVPGPYVKLGLGATVTVTPQALSTTRQAAFGKVPDGTAALSLSENATSDVLSIPCTVGAGTSFSYALGTFTATPRQIL